MISAVTSPRAERCACNVPSMLLLILLLLISIPDDEDDEIDEEEDVAPDPRAEGGAAEKPATVVTPTDGGAVAVGAAAVVVVVRARFSSCDTAIPARDTGRKEEDTSDALMSASVGGSGFTGRVNEGVVRDVCCGCASCVDGNGDGDEVESVDVDDVDVGKVNVTEGVVRDLFAKLPSG